MSLTSPALAGGLFTPELPGEPSDMRCRGKCPRTPDTGDKRKAVTTRVHVRLRSGFNPRGWDRAGFHIALLLLFLIFQKKVFYHQKTQLGVNVHEST